MCFGAVHDLHITINRFVVETHDNPKPLGWTADPNRLFPAIDRGKLPYRISLLAPRNNFNSSMLSVPLGVNS